MAGLRPIGSEKLEGMDKIRRIMEIARYNENIPQSVNETKSTEYKISLADGNSYEIVKERQGYIIKQNINESETEYIEPMQNRKYYSSYSQALKRLNLMTKEINTLYENEEGTPLLGEQKKKFILKTKKPKAQEPVAEPAPLPEPAPAPAMPEPPVSEPTPELPPAPEMGAEGELPPPSDMGGEESAFSPDMEDDEEMPDFGAEEEMDIDVEEKPKEKKVSDIKRIQILVGKLSQKIRSYEEEKELSAQNVKYIINSILSAIDVDVLDEDDIEEIISKLEGGVEDEDNDNEGMEDMEIEDEEVVDSDIAPEPPAEPEMGEGYDSIADAFQDYMGAAYSNVAMRNMQGEKTEEVYEADLVDDYHKDRRKGRKHFHYPDVDTFSHGTFNESSVDKVLSKYFTLNEEDERSLKLKQERKTSLVYKQNKENVIKLSESADQLDVALEYISKNPRVKLMGRSNKGNLIFKEGINEVKITRRGDII
jgi:hypothetical protein